MENNCSMVRQILIKLFKSVFSFFIKEKIKKHAITLNEKNSNMFYGYYDTSPFNPVNPDFICFHKQKRNSTRVDIVLKDLESGKSQTIDSSLAWNYQQGAKLAWFDEKSVIFNDFDVEKKKYISKIINIHNNTTQIIPYPVQALYKQKYLLAIDYHNLEKLGTEYGYKYQDMLYPKGSVVNYNFEDKTSKEIIKEEDCIHILNLRNITDIERQHINHISISPDGTFFIFIFRYFINGKRIDNLLSYNMNDRKLNILAKEQVISHFTWRNNNEFLVWAVIDRQAGYFLFEKNTNYKLVLNYKRDGHPTFLDENTFITDTYPNPYLIQELFTYNIETKEKKVILRVKHPAFYKSKNRCDLHPSVSTDKKFFQIDFIRKNKRAICIGQL